jgi:hypothetical protein
MHEETLSDESPVLKNGNVGSDLLQTILELFSTSLCPSSVGLESRMGSFCMRP